MTIVFIDGLGLVLKLNDALTCAVTGGPANKALYAEAATDKAPFTSPPAMLLPWWWCLWKKTELSPPKAQSITFLQDNLSSNP